MDMLDNDSHRPSGVSSTLRSILLFSGMFLLFCAVALPLLDRHDDTPPVDDHITGTSRATFEQLLDMRRRCALAVDRTAARLAGTGREQARKILLEYAGLFPEANFTLYGQRSEPLISVGPVQPGQVPADGAPSPETQVVSSIAAKFPADSGYAGLTVLNDTLGVCAARTVSGGGGRTLMVSLPLGPDAVARLEQVVGADIAVLPAVPFAAGKNLGSLVPALTAAAPDMSIAPEASAFRVIELSVNDARRNVGVQPLQNSLGETEAYLYVASHRTPVVAEPAPARWWHNPALPYVFALFGLLGLLLWHRSKQQTLCDAVNTGLQDALDAELSALPEAPAALPDTLRATLGSVAETLATRKDLARKAVERLTEDRPQEQPSDCSGPIGKERSIAGRHFDNAANGIYQCSTTGALLRINLPFALLLGYDSSMHLQAEHRNIVDLFAHPEEAPRVLADLREEPHARLPVLFRLRDGSTHPFWMTCFPRTGDEMEPMEGFLIDREPELVLERVRRERDEAVERSSSLAKLLAATCLQTQAYFAPRPVDACETGEKEAAAPGKERRRGINSLKDIFDDIYRVAVSAAEDVTPAMVPVDVYGLMDRIYRQALPAMAAKNIDLTLDVEPGITTKVSGPDALLRHTLLRCLFMITAPVSGGSAILGISRDQYTAPQPGTLRLIFSASWVPNMDPPYDQTFGANECLDSGNPMADKAMTAPAMSPLELKDEWMVIEYLVQRMNGQPLGSAASHNARAVQFMVQLDTGEAIVQPASPTPPPAGDEFSLSGLVDEEAPVPDGKLTPEEIAPTLVFDEQAADEEPLEDDASSPGLDILLVDDSPNTRMLFSLYLKGTKHRITEAHNGREGLDAFGGKNFDVVFMDLEMPLMDGYQATRIIRAMEADAGKKPTPIVAVTGYTLPEARHECFYAGCSEFLAKPFSKNALLSMLEAIEQSVRKGA